MRRPTGTSVAALYAMASAVVEVSAGVVVFRDRAERDGRREYLLLQSVRGTWEFPKGKVERGETYLAAALRELGEESGLTDVTVVNGFARQVRYHFRGRAKGQAGRLVDKTVHFVLARAAPPADRVRLSREHRRFAYLSAAAAARRLSHAGTRAVLRAAVQFLDGHPHTSPAGSSTLNR